MQDKTSLLTRFFSIIITFNIAILNGDNNSACSKKILTPNYFNRGLNTLLDDAFGVVGNLFCRDTLKIVTGFLPIYLLSRMQDERIHKSFFYDKQRHKNLCEHNSFFYHLADEGVAIPFSAAFLSFLFSSDCDLHTTSRVFLISLPITWATRTAIKEIKLDCCLRPWNQHFSRKHRSFGGFPSGHMLEMSYMTALYAMRFGPKWGVPLGIYSAFIFSEFLVCNRHYLSQLVAGTALGVAFAYSANKTIERDLKKNRWDFDVSCDRCGNANLKVTYKF